MPLMVITTTQYPSLTLVYSPEIGSISRLRPHPPQPASGFCEARSSSTCSFMKRNSSDRPRSASIDKAKSRIASVGITPSHSASG